MNRLRHSLVLTFLLMLAAIPAIADPVTFSFTSGGLGASATFDVSGSDLHVTLANTGSGDVLLEQQILTGVFFTIPGGDGLSRTSSVLSFGSEVFYDPDGQPAGGVVGGEFAYKCGLSGAPNDADCGISSAGLGLFGAGNLFPGSDLAGPPSRSPDGGQYGLLSAGDDTSTGNAGNVLGSGGMIKNSVDFTLGGLPEGFKLNDISNVSFQYGTSLDDPNFGASVPEPTSLLLLGTGLLGFSFAMRRKKKK